MLSKNNKRRNAKKQKQKSIGIFQKILLGNILVILLWSRLLASYSAIQEVHASFPTNLSRGEINQPYVENQEQSAVAHINAQAELSQNHGIRLQRITEDEKKADRIRAFYSRWGAPMAANADYIVQTSNLFGLDFRLIPAISIVESSGGKFCFRPYNAFGWGKTGFSSYNDAIYTVAKGLRNGYGTDNPYAIAPSYNPVTPDAWASKVAGLMGQI